MLILFKKQIISMSLFCFVFAQKNDPNPKFPEVSLFLEKADMFNPAARSLDRKPAWKDGLWEL